MIKIQKEEYITRITFSKPPLNIFNIEDLLNLGKVLRELNNQENLKLIIIDSDQKVFSAGVNAADHTQENIVKMLSAFHEVFYAMLDLEIPTMSLVRSACLGGGCEIALFCDFVIASENAVFSQPEIKLGCFPPVSLIHLSQLIGDKKALELILTGNKLSAKEAAQLGLINHACKEEEFEEKSLEFIKSIVSNSPSVMRTTLKAYKNINYKSAIKENLVKAEKIYLEELMQLEDTKEGIQSFLEKRPPVWKNR